MSQSLPDRLPSAAPGLRAYGGVRYADVNGKIDRDEYDYQPTTGSGERHSLDKNLAADSVWWSIWDSSTSMISTFVWGRVIGTGGTWYLEITNAAADVFQLEMRTSAEHPFQTGGSYSGVAGSAITKLRARVLTGATATKLDGYLVR